MDTATPSLNGDVSLSSVRPKVPRWAFRLARWLAVPLVAAASILTFRAAVPVPARMHRVDRGPVYVEAFGRGTVETEREANLGFDMVGRVAEVLVEEGDRVKQGQELARLSAEQVEADLRTAVSTIGAARNALQRLAAEEARSRVAVSASERENVRAEQLAHNGIISQRELDESRDQLRLARADHDRILAQRSEALGEIDVASGGAGQRRATIQRSALFAPFDGVIARRVRDPGNAVNVGSTVLRIVDDEHVYVRAWIDETMRPQLKQGLEAELLFPGSADRWTAKVIRIGTESDRQTHELLVDLRPDDFKRRVTIGQRVDVAIRTDVRPAALRIPQAFVRHEVDGDSCFVDRGGTTAVARVKLGKVGREYIEVLEGLAEGDRVLRAPEPGGLVAVGRKWKARP